jgi:hypothetical protein
MYVLRLSDALSVKEPNKCLADGRRDHLMRGAGYSLLLCCIDWPDTEL